VLLWLSFCHWWGSSLAVTTDPGAVSLSEGAAGTRRAAVRAQELPHGRVLKCCGCTCRARKTAESDTVLVSGSLVATLQAALAAMRPLRQTLELFLSREEPLAPAAPPGGRHSSFTVAAQTLNGPQALDAGSRTLARYLSRRTRDARGSAVPAGEVKGGDPGGPRTPRARIRFGSDASQLVVRVLSAELSSSARLLRESRAGELRREHELGWVLGMAAARQGAGGAAAFVRTSHGS